MQISIPALTLALMQSAPVGPLAPCAVEGVDGAVECGTFRVFENRDLMSGREIELRVVVVRATDSPLPDPIVLVAGGPGQAATSLARLYVDAYSDFRRQHDLVLVDQRGTGGSNDLACRGPMPSGPTSTFGALFPPDHIRQCRDRLTAHADLKWYHTEAASDDMEEVLDWLGYERANFVGGSYGMRFVLDFMRRHPDRVRTAVLNGIAPVHVSPYVWGSLSLQRAFDRLVDQCRTDASCNAAFPSFRSEFNALVGRLAQHSERVRLASGAQVTMDLGDFAYAVRGMLYGPLAYELPFMVHEATSSGDLTPFAEFYLGRSQWVGGPFSTGMHLSTICGEDFRHADRSEAESAVGHTFMGLLLYDRYAQACELWDVPDVPVSFTVPVRSDIPTFILSGTLDPVTPLEWGDEVAAHLTNASHLIVEGGGHGVGGPCVDGFVTSLIDTGRLPETGDGCSSEAPPGTFKLR